MRITAAVLGVVLSACGSDGGGGGPDAAPLVRGDRHYVISHFTLPSAFEDVEAGSFEYPNSDGAVNNLGNTIVALLELLEGIPVQDDLDAGMDAKVAPQAMRIYSAAPDDDPAVEVAFGDVSDDDDDDVYTEVDLNPYVEGELDDGTLDAISEDADLIISMPLVLGGEVSRIHATAPRIRIELTEDGYTGAFSAALTEDDVHADVYPAIASLVTRAIAENTPKAAQLKSVFDANSDNTVTVAELENSPTLQQLTRPDLDLDGDGTPEHLSCGMPYEGVRVEIQ